MTGRKKERRKREREREREKKKRVTLAEITNVRKRGKYYRTHIAVHFKDISHVSNRAYDPPLLLLQHLLFVEGFPLSSETLIVEFVSILPEGW